MIEKSLSAKAIAYDNDAVQALAEAIGALRKEGFEPWIIIVGKWPDGRWRACVTGEKEAEHGR